MHDDQPSMKEVWAAQETEGFSMSLQEIRAQAEKFRGKIRHRNAREYIGSAIVLVVFGFYAWSLPGIVTKIGSLLVMLGVLFMSWQLHRRTAPQADPGEDCVAYYRGELIRQRQALLSVGGWYLLPFMPGVVVMLYGLYVQRPSSHVAVLLTAVFCAAFFVVIWALNRWAAARLQRKIDRLGQFRSE